jgi:hypothetical protein
MSQGVSSTTLKTGTAVKYKVGYSFKQNSTSTAALGHSPATSWNAVDGAYSLVMTGVSTALIALAF